MGEDADHVGVREDGRDIRGGGHCLLQHGDVTSVREPQGAEEAGRAVEDVYAGGAGAKRGQSVLDPPCRHLELMFEQRDSGQAEERGGGGGGRRRRGGEGRRFSKEGGAGWGS